MTVARRSDLPGGTVTLVFTDIEGSTQLLRRLGPDYARVQEEHHRLLRETIERFDGREVDTQGDAFFIAFRSAHDAVNAAGEIHRGLAAHPWPAGVDVRVRIGAHTGQPERRAEGYVGIDVVQGARICAVAHGGQTVVSEVTRDLVAKAGIETIDLGTYALKDFPVGLRLFQPLGAGLGRDFPPLRTLHATNLPAIPTPLVGRARELELVSDLLRRPGTRVITLAGTGGAGKSRLALEVARRALREFPDGVYLVRLAQISDPRLVLAEIGRVLGIGDESSRPRLDVIADALRGKRVLLLMDNFEHVATAARDLGLLLRRTPGPTILATSRGRLRIAGEHVVQVGPLPEDDAATLFLGRAAAADPAFSGSEADHEIVEQICRRVDCLPLAIELAAARAPVIGLEALLDRLDDALGLLTAGLRDAPARHQTLRGESRSTTSGSAPTSTRSRSARLPPISCARGRAFSTPTSSIRTSTASSRGRLCAFRCVSRRSTGSTSSGRDAGSASPTARWPRSRMCTSRSRRASPATSPRPRVSTRRASRSSTTASRPRATWSRSRTTSRASSASAASFRSRGTSCSSAPSLGHVLGYRG
jgi:class 3 adenylate cyclase